MAILRKHYSTFPGGKLGGGLLILRTTIGVGTALFGGILISRLESLAAGQVAYFCHLVIGLLLISGSVFLILGFVTPSVSITVVGCQLISAYIGLSVGNPLQGKRFGWVALLLLAGVTFALFFLGPGAYSIDANLYGRKRIFIPSSKTETKEDP